MLDWQVLLYHVPVMTSLSIAMQFDLATCGFPGGIHGHVSIRDKRIVSRKSDEQRRRIGWHHAITLTTEIRSCIGPDSAMTGDRSHEIRAAIRLVLSGRADGDDTTRRVARDTDALRVDTPCGSTLPDYSEGLFSVHHRQRRMRSPLLPHLFLLLRNLF